MWGTRILALALAATLIGACAQTAAPPQPGQRIVVTDRTTGKRIQTTYGELSVIAAFVELRQRNYGRAIAIATAAINSNSLTGPERSLNHTARGIAQLILNNPAAARTDFDSAISYDPQNWLAWAERGALNANQRLFGEAMADLDRSIAIKPTAMAYFERGRVLLARRRVAEARASFDHAIVLNPRFATAYFARGLTNHIAGALQQARNDYQQAIDLNPNFEAARRAMALLQRRAPAPPLQPRGRAGDVVQF
ncbi:MAG: tetratricopeptide repeat protein [Rhodospirillaceae bacterium]|nr:tetratricopeptide repeat protein [Rhodospirillaceae bacterium]